MLRIAMSFLVCVALLLSILLAEDVRAVGPSETLLPPKTKAFASITNVDEMREHWEGTQLGQLMADPVMEPFTKDLRRQLEERFSGIQDRLGITLDDLEDVPGGELATALVEVGREKWGTVLLADVTGHIEEAQAMLKKASENQLRRGATRQERSVAGKKITVFDVPEEGRKERLQVIYFLENDLLVAADDLDATEAVLVRIGGGGEGSLAELAEFRAIMDRCQKDIGERKPQMRWFVEPFSYLEAVRKAAFERDRLQEPRRGASMLEIFESVGFTAMRAAGGFIDVGVDGYEFFHRTAAFAPPPHESSMKMMVFPNNSEFTPQRWVPREVATYSCGYCEILNAFDHFGPLFDELFGEGEKGVWDDVLDGLKNDPNGPQIDLRAELVSQLTNRVTVVSDNKLPVTTTSERLLFAVETKDEAAVAAAMEKTLKDDKEVRRREFNGHVIWETIPEEARATPRIRIELPALSGGYPGDEDRQDEEEAEPLFPNASVTVAHGNLMVASHYDFLIKILTPVEEREALERSIDWMIVGSTLKKLGAGEDCVRTFSRTADEYRAAYEMLRQGKMPQSESMLGRVLNTAFGAPDTGEYRDPEIDGSKLPDFEFVRRNLGPAGMFGVSEKTGWFFKGFALPNQGL